MGDEEYVTQYAFTGIHSLISEAALTWNYRLRLTTSITMRRQRSGCNRQTRCSQTCETSFHVAYSIRRQPATISVFLHTCQLMNILGWALKTIYPLNKGKIRVGHVGPQWELQAGQTREAQLCSFDTDYTSYSLRHG